VELPGPPIHAPAGCPETSGVAPDFGVPGSVVGPYAGVYESIARATVLSTRDRQVAVDRTTLQVGLETRVPFDRYAWDGLRRGGDSKHPMLVVQYTLGGAGAWEQNGQTTRLLPGSAFFVIVSSAHRYLLPAGSDSWTFFWFVTRHPYVVSRVARRQKSAGAVLDVPVDSVLLVSMVRLVEDTAREAFRDPFAREQAQLEFMVEHDRFTHRQLYPQARRQLLLDEVRTRVMRDLATSPSVDELAARYDMSRSHFSHHFKSVTGLSPARFITDVRLQEVARRLGQTRDTLKQIAVHTGFADANHLCKVFRRFYHVSPGAFRKQVR